MLAQKEVSAERADPSSADDAVVAERQYDTGQPGFRYRKHQNRTGQA